MHPSLSPSYSLSSSLAKKNDNTDRMTIAHALVFFSFHSYINLFFAVKAVKKLQLQKKITLSQWPEGELQGQGEVVVRSRKVNPVGVFLCLG